MRLRLTTLGALMLATSLPLAGQDASSLAGRSRDQAALAGVDQRLVNRFPASVALRFDALLDSATASGLPSEPLVLRALEGGAKGVPADRIHQSMSRLLSALTRAHSALGPATPSGDLTTAAGALQTGLEPQKLVELRNLRKDRSLTVPLGAYLDLVARGAVPERAWLTVIELARRGVDDRDYEQLDAAGLVARQPEDRR